MTLKKLGVSILTRPILSRQCVRMGKMQDVEIFGKGVYLA